MRARQSPAAIAAYLLSQSYACGQGRRDGARNLPGIIHLVGGFQAEYFIARSIAIKGGVGTEICRCDGHR
jgi:hypothetical protein